MKHSTEKRNYPVIMRPAKRRRPSEIHWRSSTVRAPPFPWRSAPSQGPSPTTRLAGGALALPTVALGQWHHSRPLPLLDALTRHHLEVRTSPPPFFPAVDSVSSSTQWWLLLPCGWRAAASIRCRHVSSCNAAISSARSTLVYAREGRRKLGTIFHDDESMSPYPASAATDSISSTADVALPG